jgi:hypothetical protein
LGPLALVLSLGSAEAAAKTAQKPKKKPSPTHHVSKPLPRNSPAARYGSLSPTACRDELKRRGVAFRDEAGARGVKIPVRLLGPLGGVLYRTDAPESERRHSPWEVFDCRLVLSLVDFGEVLRQHEVVEARIFSAWRPPPKKGGATSPRRHPAALAVDVRTFKKANGEELSVLDHFGGRIGAPVCGPGRSPEPDCPEGQALREIVCGAADAHIFNSILTPNHDVPHRNHFHLEVTPGVGWFILE